MGTKKKVEMNKNEFLLHFRLPLHLCFDPKKKVAGWEWFGYPQGAKEVAEPPLGAQGSGYGHPQFFKLTNG